MDGEGTYCSVTILVVNDDGIFVEVAILVGVEVLRGHSVAIGTVHWHSINKN